MIEPDESFDWVETLGDDDGDDYIDRDYLEKNYVPGDMTTEQYRTLILEQCAGSCDTCRTAHFNTYTR